MLHDPDDRVWSEVHKRLERRHVLAAAIIGRCDAYLDTLTRQGLVAAASELSRFPGFFKSAFSSPSRKAPSLRHPGRPWCAGVTVDWARSRQAGSFFF
jgi:hypothetical protein